MNVFITGGSRGIGAACVRLFAEQANRVGFCYKDNEARANALAAQTGAASYRADVSRGAELATAIENFGAVDLLIVNAGISLVKLFQDTTDEDWRRVLDTNFFGAIRAVRAVLPAMLRGKSGTIITVGSVWGIEGASCEAAYAASKGALIALSRSLSAELAPSNIAVECVCPGFVDTEMNAHLSESEVADFLAERGEERKTPDDIAREIAELARRVRR